MLASAIVAVALVALAWGRFVGRDRPPVDPAASLDAAQALARGVSLGRQGRHIESLPFFERAAAVGTDWVVHWNYAAALNNASLEVWDRHGFVGSASRSSVERLALVKGALAQMAEAELRAPDARTRAIIISGRGRTLERWGFAVEALALYGEAQAVDPGCEEARRDEIACRAALQHP